MIVAGRAVLAERAAAVPVPAAATLTEVTTARIAMVDGYAVARVFTGQVQAAQRSDLSFELGGTVAEVLFDEGDRMDAGTPVARLDTRLIDAEIARLIATKAALAAQADLAERTTRRQKALQTQGFASEQALDSASLGLAELNARIAEVEASLLAANIRREKATIRAPFDGQVAARLIDVGSTAGAGAPVLRLSQAAAPQFRVGVPVAVAEGMAPGDRLTVAFGATDHTARIAAILPELDAATRTRTVLLDLPTGAMPPFGETGRLILAQTVALRGAWVPLSALEAGPRGLWRILTVEDRGGQPTVGNETVEVLFADADRAFVRGTFRDGAAFIVDGAHRVVPGQPVTELAGGA